MIGVHIHLFKRHVERRNENGNFSKDNTHTSSSLLLYNTFRFIAKRSYSKKDHYTWYECFIEIPKISNFNHNFVIVPIMIWDAGGNRLNYSLLQISKLFSHFSNYIYQINVKSITFLKFCVYSFLCLNKFKAYSLILTQYTV